MKASGWLTDCKAHSSCLQQYTDVESCCFLLCFARPPAGPCCDSAQLNSYLNSPEAVELSALTTVIQGGRAVLPGGGAGGTSNAGEDVGPPVVVEADGAGFGGWWLIVQILGGDLLVGGVLAGIKICHHVAGNQLCRQHSDKQLESEPEPGYSCSTTLCKMAGTVMMMPQY